MKTSLIVLLAGFFLLPGMAGALSNDMSQNDLINTGYRYYDIGDGWGYWLMGNGNTIYLDYGNDYQFNHWVSTSMISNTFDKIKSIALSNKRDIEENLQLYYENYYYSDIGNGVGVWENGGSQNFASNYGGGNDNGKWYNVGPCPECAAKCEEMNNFRGQYNLPLLDCSRYQ
jgi:hypothetical protein